MILDYLSRDWLVQLGFIAALAAGYIVTLVRNGWAKEAEAERQEKRYADARAVMISTGKKVATTQNNCD